MVAATALAVVVDMVAAAEVVTVMSDGGARSVVDAALRAGRLFAHYFYVSI